MTSSTATKPIPSPGRPDKYPAPLMRFLRGTTASKSTRSHSRATPLFTRRKRSVLESHQEPSSPKVTCIGQVRVRRSSSKSKHRAGPPPPLKRRPSTNAGAGAGNWFSFWVGKPPATASCCSFRRRKRSCFRPVWRRWVAFFCCRSAESSRKGSDLTGSARIYTDTDSDSYDIRDHRFQNGEGDDSSGRVNGSGQSPTPPKNALLLTRCRSAPQRSSYLASQIWRSPEKTEQEENKEIPAVAKPKIDREDEGILGICREDKISETEKVNEEDENGEEKKIIVLKRCKSEPARRSGDPLNSNFWKEKSRDSVETK